VSYLAIAPYIVASILALIICVRRPNWGRLTSIVLISILGLLGWLLTIHSRTPSSSRTIILLDTKSPSEFVAGRVRGVLERLGADGLVGYDLVRVTGNPTPDTQDAKARLRDREWRRGASWDPGQDDLEAKDPEQALALACDRLDALPWHQKLIDLFLLRSRRIVVLVTAPDSWSEYRLRIAELVARLSQVDASVDLLVNSIDDPTPSLEIHFDRPSIAPNTLPESFVYRLRMESQHLSKNPGAEARYKASCTIDDGPGAAAPRFVMTRAGTARVSSTGAFEVELFLSEFRLVGSSEAITLTPGFHLISCTLECEAGGKREVASEKSYLRVESSTVVFVAGSGARFGSQPATRASLQAYWNSLPRYGPFARRWPPTVEFLVPRPTLGDFANFWSEDDLIAFEGRAPFMVVAHDLSDSAWDALSKKLGGWVASGTHLLVSGAPTDSAGRRTEIDWLPALARGQPIPAGGDHFIRVERRPRLVVIRDDSRLGRLPIAPGSLGRTSVNINPQRFIRTGTDAQTALIRSLFGNLVPAIVLDDVDAPTMLKLRDPASQYPIAGILVVSGLSSPECPSQDLIQPSSIPDRLAQLLPELPPGVSRLDHVFMTDQARPFSPRPSWEKGINDVIILLTYEGAKQPGSRKGVLARLLASGANVLEVRFESPFVDGANKKAPAGYDISPDAVIANDLDELNTDRSLTSNSILNAAQARSRYLKAGTIRLETQGGDLDSQIEQLATELAAHIQPHLEMRHEVVIRHRLDRFIDERVFPALDEGKLPDKPTADQAWAGPMRYQHLEGRHGASYASVTGVAGQWGVLSPGALAVGDLHGRGSVLVLGYSIFEGQVPPSEIPRWEDVPYRNRIAPKPFEDVADHWGPQRVIDIAEFASNLEQFASIAPKLHGIEVRDTRGRLRLECLATIVPKMPGGAVPVPKLSVTPATGGTPIPDLAPVDIDPVRGRVFYELKPSEISTLLGIGNEASAGTVTVSGVALFLEGRPASVQADLDAISEVSAIARYTGGVEVDQVNAIRSRPAALRVPLVLAFTGVFVALLGARAVRRLLGLRAVTRQGQEQISRMRFDDAPGLVAQAGESLGRPSGVLRAGAFAGYRSFEPGDRLELAVREDLLLSTLFNIPLIPRIPQRIDDRATKLVIVVNVSRGMRTPAAGRKGPGPKIAASALLTELLSELAWARRAEVTILATGLDSAPPPLGPLSGSPGPGQVAAQIVKWASHRSSWSASVSLPCDEVGGSMAFVSDFLNEDLEQLARNASLFEQEGGGFGAVHIYSPAEYHLLGSGFSPSSGVFAERTEWTSDDLKGAHAALVFELASRWDPFRGGFTAISSSYSAEQMLEVIRDGRFLDIFR